MLNQIPHLDGSDLNAGLGQGLSRWELDPRRRGGWAT